MIIPNNKLKRTLHVNIDFEEDNVYLFEIDLWAYAIDMVAKNFLYPEIY